MSKKPTQKQRVLGHIYEHGYITSLDGLKMEPAIVHIPSVIRDLKKDGLDIVARDVRSNGGAIYRRWYLATGRSISCPHCQARMDKGLVDWIDNKHTAWVCPACGDTIKPEEWLTEGMLDDILNGHGGAASAPDAEYDARRAEYEHRMTTKYR